MKGFSVAGGGSGAQNGAVGWDGHPGRLFLTARTAPCDPSLLLLTGRGRRAKREGEPPMRSVTAVYVAVGLLAPACLAYVEVPYTLGRTCQESTNILLVEVTRVNKEKGTVVFKKLKDLKGQHPGDEIKHNIGKRGFHPREWQTILAWA